MKNLPFHRRLGFACAGVLRALRSENSFRFHAAASCGVLLALLVLRPPPVWWAVMLLTVGAVLAAELFNTALEHLADHLHPEQHPSIKIVKDCAAAAVLVTSLIAVGVAIAFIWEFFVAR